MLGLTKVNDNWVPLQAKVFSRWVSNQLKNVQEVEVQDVQKDLSNGVALVELATVLTQKQPTRQWTHNPRLKVEMVQNCELALDMFTKDGVNFVGISGKDISDNNQKLILGFIWTLILYYSVNKSVNNNNDYYKNKETINTKENSTKTKENKETAINGKTALMNWAIQRTENYPNIHNFTPYDLSLCALLDSYFPQKINYYSLNPNDHEYNTLLATEVMEEIGIPVYVYPDEVNKFEDKVDDKTLLTQLSSAKVVLDNAKTQIKATEKSISVDEKEDSNEYSDEEQQEENENFIEESIEAQRKIEDQAHQINQLTIDYEDARNDVKSQVEARMKIENDLSDLTKAYLELKDHYNNERNQKMAYEAQIAQEQEARNKLLEEKELILKSYANLEAEKDEEKCARIQAESEISSLKNANEQAEAKIKELTSQLESSQNDVRILSQALKEPKHDESSVEGLKDEISRLTTALEDAEEYLEEVHDKKEKLKNNLFALTHEFIRLKKHYRHEKKAKLEYREELQRLSIAFDALMIEKNVEADARDDAEAELEILRNQKSSNQTNNHVSETLHTYSKIIQNMLEKLHNIKEEKKEVEFKNVCLSGALIKSIKELTDARKKELHTKELEEEIERLNNELENVEDYIESEKDKKQQLQNDFNLLESEFIHLANDFEYERQAKREYRSEVKRLVCAFDAAQIEKDVETEEREDAEFQLEELKNALEKTEEKLEETQKRSNETIKTYSKVIQKILLKLHLEKEARKEAEFDNVRLSGALVETVNDLVDAKGNQNEKAVLEAEIERLSAELENLETYCEIQNEKKEMAETKVHILQAKMEGLESEINEADNEVERLTYALELHQNFDDSKSDALERAKSEITDMYSEVASAKYSVKKLEKAYEQAQQRIRILTNALQESQKNAFIESNELRSAQLNEREIEDHFDDIESFGEAEEQEQEIMREEIKNNSELIREEKVYSRMDDVDNDFVGLPMDENNFRLSGQKFGLTMTIDGEDYALTLIDNGDHFLNASGLKLDLTPANIEHDINQQFIFGKDSWNTVIDSFSHKGMVWDVANADSWNPPNGTEFYLFPFHGRHNQHFIYKDDMIYAKQNGQVVTYVGYDVPFVMAAPTEALKEKQTFHIQLL